jgi:hypothetical protein
MPAFSLSADAIHNPTRLLRGDRPQRPFPVPRAIDSLLSTMLASVSMFEIGARELSKRRRLTR